MPMRFHLAIALLVFGFAGSSAASAADSPIGRSAAYFSTNGQRSVLRVGYASEPGIVVRAYWHAPWHNHHYFPFTGRRPHIGRKENLSAVSHVRPAKSFRRSWSNAAAYERSLAQAPLQSADADTGADAASPDQQSLRHRHSMRHLNYLKRRKLAPSH
jgi:hypothetical protein